MESRPLKNQSEYTKYLPYIIISYMTNVAKFQQNYF